MTNSTQDVLEKRIAALEGGVAALATASGAAAITYTIQALAQALNRPNKVRSAKGIINDQRQTMDMSNFCNCVNIRNITVWIPQCLQINCLSKPDPATDARAVPIYQTTSYVFRDSAHAAARFELAEAGNIVKELVKNRMLATMRGKGGGYRLNHSPEEYNIKSILELMEGSLVPVTCLEPGINILTK